MARSLAQASGFLPGERAEVFWHSRETERGGDAAGGKYGRRVGEGAEEEAG